MLVGDVLKLWSFALGDNAVVLADPLQEYVSGPASTVSFGLRDKTEDKFTWYSDYIQGSAKYAPGLGLAIERRAAVVAAPKGNEAYAYIYEADEEGKWTHDPVISDGGTTSKLGTSVAMTEDTIVMGAPSDLFNTPNGIVTGSAHVYTRSSMTSWKMPNEAVLYVNSNTTTDFGRAVALSFNTLMVGAPSANNVYVYERPLGLDTFNQVAKIVPSVADASFGAALAFDGVTLVVGAPSANAVYMFEQADSEWKEVKRVTGTSGTTGFGTSVSVSNDILVIGSPLETTPTGQGAAHVMWRDKDGWKPLMVIEGDVMEADTGVVVAVRGSTLMVSSKSHPQAQASVTREYFIKR